MHDRQHRARARWGSSGRSIGAVAAAALIASVAWAMPEAEAQSVGGASCSAAYHAALAALTADRGEELTKAIANMRAADPALPGRWIYSQALLGKAERALPEPRPCLEPFKVAGRLRCKRFGDATAKSDLSAPSELEITPAPAAADLRLLKAVADLVRGRGGVPDIGPNGRFRWLAERATSDLKLYITQPAHPALCAGAKEVTEFYEISLQPLQKRAEAVEDLVKKAHAAAVANVAAARTQAEDSAGAPSTGGGTAPAPPATAVADDVALEKMSLVALVGEAVRPVLEGDATSAVLAETSPLAALMRAKPFLIAAQVAAKQSGDAVLQARILAVGRAVQMIEAAAYAETYAERYRRFSAAVLTLPRDIQSVHEKTCTCGD